MLELKIIPLAKYYTYKFLNSVCGYGYFSLQVAAINTAMAALTKTVGVFPKERAIVDRERAKGSYTLGPYLLSKLLAEIPIGAAFPLVFGTILYPMARLNPTASRSGPGHSVIGCQNQAIFATNNICLKNNFEGLGVICFLPVFVYRYFGWDS